MATNKTARPLNTIGTALSDAVWEQIREAAAATVAKRPPMTAGRQERAAHRYAEAAR
ncbi:hypothetical protein [Actinoplanes sp. NPDC049802]|uniref:hypothetical protein n=1 Tax=Actinoplanes sp. NPDC049802 TaxID=3154742 RepID=UPI0033C976ED